MACVPIVHSENECWHCKITKHVGWIKVSLKTCVRCNMAKYCGSACQSADWTKHKASCKYLHGQSEHLENMIAYANCLDLQTKSQIGGAINLMKPIGHRVAVCYGHNNTMVLDADQPHKFENLVRPMCEGYIQVLVVLNEQVCSFVLNRGDGYKEKMSNDTIERASNRALNKRKLVRIVTKSKRLTAIERRVAKMISIAVRNHYILYTRDESSVIKTQDDSSVIDVCDPEYIREQKTDPADSTQEYYEKIWKLEARKRVKKSVMALPHPTKKCQRIRLNRENFPWLLSWECTCGGKKCRT